MPFIPSLKSTHGLTHSEITKQAWKNGVYNALIKPCENRLCKNPACNKVFKAKPHEKKKYCSSRCAAIVNNLKRPKKYYFCSICNRPIKRANRKYCSIKCQHKHYHIQYIARWKQGLENGNRGIRTRGISHHLRHYLIKKYEDKCSRCGWNKKHPKTLVVPLEVNHIDGNSENNKEENLELICPNCHALTPNFRNLNKGNGRSWRLGLK